NIERRKKGIKEQHDFELIKKDGARIFVTMEASPNFDENGEYTGGVAGVIDITERKKADEQIANSLREKETLLREIHHRVKNNMQVISSLMTLQSAYIKDKEAAAIFRESQERIKSMAIVHERLYLSENLAEIDLGEYIDALTKDIMRAFGAEPSRIGLEINTGAEVKLNIDTGIPCGLILNELITNSIKHAFPGGRTGKIIIDVNSDAEGYVTLKIIDNGTGLPEGFDHQNAKTLGLRLVHMLVRQLKGSIEKADTAGTVFIIKFKNVLA
ncbi:MAG: PAS domain S-box protein, partial [Nitrospirae bacterium]|nr:PAS domain S-box protein [Nitrospirota bacterium]